MQHFINLTNDPNLGARRTGEVRNFQWNIFEDYIKVNVRVYYTKLDGSFLSKPEPYEKELTVDNKDYINNATGQIILGDVYNAANVTDAEGVVSNPTYPSVTPQYTFMVNLILGTLKAQGMTINDSTKVSDILLTLINQNINGSDQNHKFDA